jgi:hypothetical protein
VKSCQEFFKELGNEQQATGAKLQATSCKKILRRVGKTKDRVYLKTDSTERYNYENK